MPRSPLRPARPRNTCPVAATIRRDMAPCYSTAENDCALRRVVLNPDLSTNVLSCSNPGRRPAPTLSSSAVSRVDVVVHSTPTGGAQVEDDVLKNTYPIARAQGI